MKTSELKKNLAKYAKTHRGDTLVLVMVKQQIARAAATPQEYEMLVKFYCEVAKL